MSHIVLLDAYHRGSHRRWAEDAAALWRRSGHEVTVLTLPGRHWKWRMHGAAAAFAQRIAEQWAGPEPDALVVTEMLDAAALRGLLPPGWRTVPLAVYFHENQLVYPWSPADPDVDAGRDRTYGWINAASALAADQVWFNSQYHRDAFLGALEPFCSAFPDAVPKALLKRLPDRSRVVYPVVSGAAFQGPRPDRAPDAPVQLIWNHRWEYDKAPEQFFAVVEALEERGIPFTLAVLGEQFSHAPEVFEQARARWGDRLVAWGAVDREAYVRILLDSDVIVHAPLQEYFGYSVVEALHAGCHPVLGAGRVYDEYAGDFAKWRTPAEAAAAIVWAFEEGFPQRERARRAAAAFEPDRLIGTYEAAVVDLVHP